MAKSHLPADLKHQGTPDEFRTFFRAVLRENGVDPDRIDMAEICSLVPDAVHALRNCFRKYFRFEPFLLQLRAKTGLKIRYGNPLEVGANKIANAIGVLAGFPGRNLLILDFGTATTLCAVTKDKEYLGGIITSGINTSMAALESETARLAMVVALHLGLLWLPSVPLVAMKLYAPLKCWGVLPSKASNRDRFTVPWQLRERLPHP